MNLVGKGSKSLEWRWGWRPGILPRNCFSFHKGEAKKGIFPFVLQTSFKYIRKNIYTCNKPPTQTPSHWLVILFEWSVGGILGSPYLIVLLSAPPGTFPVHTSDGRAASPRALCGTLSLQMATERLCEVELPCRNPEMKTFLESLCTNYLALQIGRISKPLWRRNAERETTWEWNKNGPIILRLN